MRWYGYISLLLIFSALIYLYRWKTEKDNVGWQIEQKCRNAEIGMKMPTELKITRSSFDGRQEVWEIVRGKTQFFFVAVNDTIVDLWDTDTTKGD